MSKKLNSQKRRSDKINLSKSILKLTKTMNKYEAQYTTIYGLKSMINLLHDQKGFRTWLKQHNKELYLKLKEIHESTKNVKKDYGIKC